MVKFLHAADIHLDSPLKGLACYDGAPVERLQRATRRALERLVDLALEQRVDFVLIAGDLYDGDWKDHNTGLFLNAQVNRLREAGIPLVAIAGNHDAANRMTRTLRLPDNVTMLDHEAPQTLAMDDLGVAIHGQSYARRDMRDDLACRYPAPRPGCLNIGLLHTGLTGADGHERYAPCTLGDLQAKGYDYWALGHIHKRAVLGDGNGAAPVVFPGNVQGRHIREPGEKGCVIVSARRGRVEGVAFHRLDVARWEHAALDAAGAEDDEALMERADAELCRLLAVEPEADGRLLAVRLSIRGASALNDRLRARPERITAELRNLANGLGGDRLWLEQVRIETRPERAGAALDGPIEELMAVLSELARDDAAVAALAPELADLRRKLPAEMLDDPDGPHCDDPDWIRGVLDDVAPLLLDLLLDPARPALSTAAP